MASKYLIVFTLILFATGECFPIGLRPKPRPKTTARPPTTTSTTSAPSTTSIFRTAPVASGRPDTFDSRSSGSNFDLLDEQYSSVSKRLCNHLLGGPCDSEKVIRIIDTVKAIVEGREDCGPKLRGSDCSSEANALLDFMMQDKRIETRVQRSASSRSRAQQTGSNDTRAEGAPLSPSYSNAGQNGTGLVASSSDEEDPDFECPVDKNEHQKYQNRPLSVYQQVVKMHDDNKSERTIQARYPWYRRQNLAYYRRCLDQGGSYSHKIRAVEDFVMSTFLDARRRFCMVNGMFIRNWAANRAREIAFTDFKASESWLLRFKKRNSIVSRKITKLISNADVCKQDLTEQHIDSFLTTYQRESSAFDHSKIWNIDQTGFNYDLAGERTLSLKGERDTHMGVGQKNAATHSYTALPMIARNGRMIGKLLLVLQEPKGEFGPRVKERVSYLEREYGNIVVYASSTGNMNAEMITSWTQDVLKPAIAKEVGEISGEKPEVLLLADSWSGHKRLHRHDVRAIGAQTLIIPPKTTSDIQPLDVGFMRQYKQLARRIRQEARLKNVTDLVTGRWGILNMQSLIQNQMSSPAYKDIITHAWHNTDSNYTNAELTKVPPLNVNGIHFATNIGRACEVNGCDNHGFIRCAHCGKVMCIHHFLKRECFHREQQMNERLQNELLRLPAENYEGDDEEALFMQNDTMSVMENDLFSDICPHD